VVVVVVVVVVALLLLLLPGTSPRPCVDNPRVFPLS